jgi:hypothetical protein
MARTDPGRHAPRAQVRKAGALLNHTQSSIEGLVRRRGARPMSSRERTSCIADLTQCTIRNGVSARYAVSRPGKISRHYGRLCG